MNYLLLNNYINNKENNQLKKEKKHKVICNQKPVLIKPLVNYILFETTLYSLQNLFQQN